jgi:hypothetical protein
VDIGRTHHGCRWDEGEPGAEPRLRPFLSRSRLLPFPLGVDAEVLFQCRSISTPGTSKRGRTGGAVQAAHTKFFASGMTAVGAQICFPKIKNKN